MLFYYNLVDNSISKKDEILLEKLVKGEYIDSGLLLASSLFGGKTIYRYSSEFPTKYYLIASYSIPAYYIFMPGLGRTSPNKSRK